jgi:predicted nucleic acid-binding protein
MISPSSGIVTLVATSRFDCVAAGYLLDANVLSETRRKRPDRGVIDFLSGVDAGGLYLSVLTLGELRKGVAARSRIDRAAARHIEAWVDGLELEFTDRVLSVVGATARRWGELSSGPSVPVIDTLIAATGLRHGLILVTRNTHDVKSTGVPLVNPWLA